MSVRYRVEGIYDREVLAEAKKLGVHDFVFDFRPRSFNFIQHHNLSKILEDASLNDRLYFRFQNEKEFVVEELIKKLPWGIASGQVNLEFSGTESREYLSKIELPFYWHLNHEAEIEEIFSLSYLRGVVLSYTFLSRLQEKGDLLGFLSTLSQKSIQFGLSNIEWVLDRDWDSDIFPSLHDFFDFNMISLPINFKVESHYRKLDHELFQTHFSRVQADFSR